MTFLFLFAVLAQSVAGMTAVVSFQVVAVPTGRLRSTVTALVAIAGSLNLTFVRRFGFREFCCVFLIIKNVLDTTRERKNYLSMRTV